MVDRNHSDLTNIIGSGMADNTSGAITAKVLRDIMTDTVDTLFAIVPASGINNTGLGASDGISPVTLGKGSGIHFAAGTNVTTTLSDTGNGSGIVTIGLGPLGNYTDNPNGLMSSFKFGRADSDGGNGVTAEIYDSSGIMLKAGTNMSITMAGHNTFPGSGVFTFNATLPSGNAITSVSAGGDTGYTWSSQDNIVSDDVAETLALVAGTGIELDIDATNNAVRFSVSGSLPLATHPSTTPASSSDNAANTFIQDITLDAYGHITGIGTNTIPSGLEAAPIASPTFTGVITTPRLVVTATGVQNINSDGIIYGSGISAGPSGLRIGGIAVTSTATELNYVDGVSSAIQTQLDAKGSGIMSKFHVGATTMPEGTKESLTDGSGLFFAAGDNMTITLTNDAHGSGVLTFASTTVAASASGNAFGAISTGNDIGYTWGASNVTAVAGSQALNIIATSGITIDTDNTNSAIRLGVSGSLPDLTGVGTITTGVWNGTTIALDQGGTGATSFGNDEVVYKPNGGSTLSSSSRMKFDGQTFTITHTSGPGITLENTNADENAGLLKFSKDGTSPATNDEIGIIEWSSEDSGSAGTTYAKILGSIADVDAGSEQGALKFFVAELDGTLTEGLTITGIDNDGDVTVDVATHDGANGGLKLGGTLVTATAAELNALDGFTGSSIGSGTMSRLKIGASDGLPQLQQLGDGSGLFFAAGSNMTITLTNNDAGSGILTFASSASGGTATSGNAFTTIAAGGDTGYTWTSQNDIVAGGDADTLKLVAGSGIRLDTDASSNAIRFSASGDYATVASPTFTGTITIGSAEISETELEILDGATLSTTELNYVDGVTSAIQTQLDTKGSGTMSRLKIGASDGLPQLQQLGDGSGLFFAAGDNMAITLTNNDAGSGILTFASDVSTNNPTFTGNITIGSAEISETELEILDGATLSTTELNYVDGVTSAIQTQLDTKGSGTMSKFHVGVNGASEAVTDGSGLMFAAGANVTISLEGNNGSGILTFSASAEGDARSVAGDTDNGLITWVTSDNTFAAESNLTYDGVTLKVAGLQGNNPSVPFIESDGIIYGSGIHAGPSGIRIDGVVIAASAAELNYVDGVTSAIQTQLDAKAAVSSPTFTGNITIGSAEISETELEILDGATLTTTELNYVDGVTSAIQTQLDTKGSGTMSRLKIGASDGLPQLQQLGDGSGLFFAAGSNMTVTLTNSDAGSGILTFASAVSTNNPTFTGNITIGSAEISETELEILDGATVTTTELNIMDAGATVTTPTVAGGDAFVMDDADVGMCQVDIDNVDTYLAATTKTLTNKTLTSPTISNPTFTGVATTPRLVVTALAGNTGGVPHIDSDGIIYGSGISAGPSGLRIGGIAVTSTATELNFVDGSSAGTVANSKAVIYSSAGIVQATDLKVPDDGGIHGGTVADFIKIGADTVTIKDGAYNFNIASHDATNGLQLGGTLVSATAAELNIMDAGATVTTPTVAGGDAFVMDDADVGMRQVDIDNVDTYLAATTKTLTNKTLTSPTITSPTITGTANLASGVIIGVPDPGTASDVSLEVAGQIRTSGVITAPITASDAATVTFDLKQSNFHMLTLARASTTLVFADAQPGQRFLTRLTQDGTGSRNVVFPGGISWARAAGLGTPPPPSSAAANSTMYGFVCTSGVAGAMCYDGFLVGSGIRGGS